MQFDSVHQLLETLRAGGMNALFRKHSGRLCQ